MMRTMGMPRESGAFFFLGRLLEQINTQHSIINVQNSTFEINYSKN